MSRRSKLRITLGKLVEPAFLMRCDHTWNAYPFYKQGLTSLEHVRKNAEPNAIVTSAFKTPFTHSCQNVNCIVNQFLIFPYRVLYCIVNRKIYKHLIKFIKNYKYTYINSIFIIIFKYIQLITNLFITYVIIFNKLTK